MIYWNTCSKSRSKIAKSPLQVDMRRSKTLWIKLPITSTLTGHTTKLTEYQDQVLSQRKSTLTL